MFMIKSSILKIFCASNNKYNNINLNLEMEICDHPQDSH